MKAIAVVPGRPNSVHLAELARPSVSDVPDGRGVLVRILRVGVDGTDKEINAAEYGAAPDGYDFLVIGHEGFGQVEAVGPNVSFLRPGDFVVATVRRPRTAAVMGTGTLGLLAALVLRLRGLEVTAFGRTPEPYLNARLLEAIGAAYVNTAERSITDAVKQSGRFDLIFEGTGSSAVVFESMQAVAKNGVLVLTSITGGDKRLEVPAERINLELVLGN